MIKKKFAEVLGVKAGLEHGFFPLILKNELISRFYTLKTER